jgi:hypothetical protein
MIKLTDEQREELANIVCRYAGVNYSQVQIAANRLIEMINTSSTHRVVEVRESYQFVDGPSESEAISGNGKSWWMNYAFVVRPIPKPCPPPQLDPVTVTVESVYAKGFKIPEGYEAKFGVVLDLQREGYTHYVLTCAWGEATMFEPLVEKFCKEYDYRICLRKWEGK